MVKRRTPNWSGFGRCSKLPSWLNRQIAESLIMQPGAGLDAVIDGLAQRIMAQSQSQMTAGQARELAQIMVMSQGENAGEGVRRLGGLAGLGGFEAR